jgi:hypothetical protein
MNFTFLISTYKNNQDILDNTIFFLKKNFDKKINLYISGNSKYKIKNVRNVSKKNEDNLIWSKRISKSLDRIDTDYFILIMDDFIIYKKINHKILKSLIQFCKKKKINYLNLNNCDNKKILKEFIIAAGTKDKIIIGKQIEEEYRINLQISIWNKSFFRKILKKNYNPWQFEININKKNNLEKIYSIHKNNIVFNYNKRGGIIRGKWTKKDFEFSKKNNPLFSRKKFRSKLTITEEILNCENIIVKSIIQLLLKLKNIKNE